MFARISLGRMGTNISTRSLLIKGCNTQHRARERIRNTLIYCSIRSYLRRDFDEVDLPFHPPHEVNTILVTEIKSKRPRCKVVSGFRDHTRIICIAAHVDREVSSEKRVGAGKDGVVHGLEVPPHHHHKHGRKDIVNGRAWKLVFDLFYLQTRVQI